MSPREYLEQGLSKTAPAAKLGIGRRVVDHWIEAVQPERVLDDEPVRYKESVRSGSQVDAAHCPR